MENGTEWRGTAGSEMTQQKQRNVFGEAYAGEGKDGDADKRKAKKCQQVGGGVGQRSRMLRRMGGSRSTL